MMGRYFAEMRVAVEGHGGRVEKFIGDAVLAVFGVPQLHEDDALRAVRAAGEMRGAAGELERVAVRRVGRGAGGADGGVYGRGRCRWR